MPLFRTVQQGLLFLLISLFAVSTGGTTAFATTEPNPENSESFPLSLALTDLCEMDNDAVTLPQVEGLTYKQNDKEVSGLTSITPDSPIDVILTDGADSQVVRTLTWENLELTDQPCGRPPTGNVIPIESIDADSADAATATHNSDDTGTTPWLLGLGGLGVLALTAILLWIRAKRSHLDTQPDASSDE